VGASLQWVPVFSGCSVDASLQWVLVFSGCEFFSGLQWSSVGASVSGCQFLAGGSQVFSRCESLVDAHPHDIEADSHVRAPTRQIQTNNPDLGRALQFWRRQTRQHASCRSNSLRFGASDPNPLLFDWVPVVGSCREIALIGLLCKGL
jgi:hypothetical protein